MNCYNKNYYLIVVVVNFIYLKLRGFWFKMVLSKRFDFFVMWYKFLKIDLVGKCL